MRDVVNLRELGVHRMNYPEALRWLRMSPGGCPVRRASWAPHKYVALDEGAHKVILDVEDPGKTVQYAPTHEDEVAEDWELGYIPFAQRPALVAA